MTAKDNNEPESPGTSRRPRACSVASGASVQKTKTGKVVRKSSSLPAETVEYLKAWMMSPEHVAHPYPTEQEKAQIMADTGIELKQLTNWFVNNRKRYWKPRVEARLQQQAQAQAVAAAAAAAAAVTLTNVPSPTNESIGCSEPSLVALDMTQPRSLVGSNNVPLGAASTSESPRVLRTVSIVSSSASESGNISDETEDDDDTSKDVTEELDEETGVVTRSETIAVHILHPTTSEKEEPTIEDVTILSNVPSTRIARSFKDVMLSYHFHEEMRNDRKKVQSRRDAEIVRVKKHYLKVFNSEVGSANKNHFGSGFKRKRQTDEPVVRRRLKYSCKNMPTMWRDACNQADSGYDDGLPSLEEAAFLFGFAQ